GQLRKQGLEVLADPRTGGGLAAEDLKGQQELLAQVSARINQIHTLAKGLRSVREQTNALVARAGIDAGTQAGNALVRKGDGVEERLINPKSKTFQDVINFRNGLNDQYLSLADSGDGTDAPV